MQKDRFKDTYLMMHLKSIRKQLDGRNEKNFNDQITVEYKNHSKQVKKYSL